MNIPLQLRLADNADLASLTDIYNQAIATGTATAHTRPVTRDERRDWLLSHPPAAYPVFVAVRERLVVGYCSLSPYRAGREALRATAEISYYVHTDHQGTGIGSALIQHAMDQCPLLGIKTLFAILLDINRPSTRILAKLGFEQWGHMPRVADFDGRECGHLYYGRRLTP
ncbi:MAG: GNAT family N-acetyltransferase [Gammaproteobacteria bacterium]